MRSNTEALTTVARAIWSVRREMEDRCDTELEDMERDHDVWVEAASVLVALASPPPASTQGEEPACDEAQAQFAALDCENWRLRMGMAKMMERLASLLDEDQFKDCEGIAADAGFTPLVTTCCGRSECGGECGGEWMGMDFAASPVGADDGWISVADRLPETGVCVLVYEPTRPDDWPDSVRISMDYICPDYEDWHDHCESYEHFMAVGGSRAAGPDVVCTGPSEAAPYTHWHPLPALPRVTPADAPKGDAS